MTFTLEQGGAYTEMERRNALQNGLGPEHIITANGAIDPHTSGRYIITKSTAIAALTLAAPTAGTEDGLLLQFTSASAEAHTITATALLQTGSANVNVATFAANAGASLTLMAYNGLWFVIAQNQISFS